MKVLLATENSLGHMPLIKVLNDFKCEVTLCETAADINSAIADKQPEMIISDANVDQLSGTDICRQIREDEGMRSYTYFILIAEHDRGRADYEEALAAGVDDFLPRSPDVARVWMRLEVARRILNYMSRIRALTQIIPICSYCNKIRDDKDYWHAIEDFMGNQMDTEFDLRVCPDCARERNISPENWVE